MSYQERPTPQEKQEADRRAQEEEQVIHVIQTARGRFTCSADELLRAHPEESFYSIYTARPPDPHPGARGEEEPQPGQDQATALYGPAGKADHRSGDTIRFIDPQSGRQLDGEILYVRAPGPAIQGGQAHPTMYITYVEGEAFPRMVYPSQVIEEKNASS